MENISYHQLDLRTTPSWDATTLKGDHLWVQTSSSGEYCYVTETCSRTGNRVKCSSCHIVIHQNCFNALMEDEKFYCKPTFVDLDLNQYERKTTTEHHWVYRQSVKNKCEQCRKAIRTKKKENLAVVCSWCKLVYHSKEECFGTNRSQECNLGIHRSIIVSPNWILKMSKCEDEADSRRNQKDTNRELFIIRAIPTDDVKPLIVFINPKSGGNQGFRLLKTFQWLLNPRQIFDLTKGGPKMGLIMYQRVPNLRILACGGDGTVGWVLSVIDQIGMSPVPAVGVLPLGTGNDLARALGWGGGYAEEPLSELLLSINNGQEILMDRWKIEIEQNSDYDDNKGKYELPLNVINNYFSLGVDAHIALEFHEAREAHPEKFNSRLKNKMFYGQLGGKDLLRRKWKNLSDFVTLECDGTDFTPKLRELKVHAIVFLNIPSYGGGTRPWNRSMGSEVPSLDDGLIEVLGLTTYQLPLLQAGGHGSCITQCKSAKIVTKKTIPMQVDGEASKVAPSILTISHLNKAVMLSHNNSNKRNAFTKPTKKMQVNVHSLNLGSSIRLNTEKDLLLKSASLLETFEVDWNLDLTGFRDVINNFVSNSKDDRLSSNWYFLDCFGLDKVIKININEEKLYFVSDIGTTDLYIVESSNETRPLTPRSTSIAIEERIRTPKLRSTSIKTDISTSLQNDKISQPQTIEFDKKNVLDKNSVVPDQDQITKPVLLPNLLPIFGTRVSERLFDFAHRYRGNCRNLHDSLHEDLVRAVADKDSKKIRILQVDGYNLGMRNQANCRLLHSASLCGHEEVVDYLIYYIFTNGRIMENL